MAKFSRDKGKRAEREVINSLQPIVNRAFEYVRRFKPEIATPRLQRNTLACDGGGEDVAGLPWLALEVKHHAALALPEWWRQCEAQARPAGREPILFYKRTGAPWKIRMYACRVFSPAERMPAAQSWLIVDTDLSQFGPVFFNLVVSHALR